MKRHEIDYFSLGAGLLFGALALVYGFTGATGSVPELRIVVPTVLLVLGAAGMASAIAAQRRSDRAAAQERTMRDEPPLL
jgi:hypothetical protein